MADTACASGPGSGATGEFPVEVAVDPDQAIVDPHHHFFADGHLPGTGAYQPADLCADMAQGHRIVATVYVECGMHYRNDGPEHLRCVGETERVDAIASVHVDRKICAGIVATADLLRGDRVDEVLEAHAVASPARLRGIRMLTASDSEVPLRVTLPADVMDSRQFRAGFSRLAGYGLSFDAWCFHHQLGGLTRLARQFPDLPIVLNHLGTPLGIGSYIDRKQEVFDAWRRGIKGLAECPNVCIKLGGLGMFMLRFDWSGGAPGSVDLAAAYRNYLLAAIDAFSPARCMFESNFPVDRRVSNYGVLWNAFKIIAAPFTTEERNAMLHESAARFYRVG